MEEISTWSWPTSKIFQKSWYLTICENHISAAWKFIHTQKRYAIVTAGHGDARFAVLEEKIWSQNINKKNLLIFCYQIFSLKTAKHATRWPAATIAYLFCVWMNFDGTEIWFSHILKYQRFWKIFEVGQLHVEISANTKVRFSWRFHMNF